MQPDVTSEKDKSIPEEFTEAAFIEPMQLTQVANGADGYIDVLELGRWQHHIFSAIRSGSIETVTKDICLYSMTKDQGAHLPSLAAAVDSYGRTLLMIAVMRAGCDIATIIIDVIEPALRDAYIQHKDKSHWDVLQYAELYKRDDILAMLQKKVGKPLSDKILRHWAHLLGFDESVQPHDILAVIPEAKCEDSSEDEKSPGH
jgi:hypothetical protein